MLIKKIKEDSNAYKRGLKTGDVISKIDNSVIKNKDDYNNTIKSYSVGDVIMIKKVRTDGFHQFIAFEIN